MGGTYTNLLIHLVFSTKDREPVIPGPLEEELFAYVGGIIRNEGGTLLAAGGMPDHVPLLAKVPPVIALSDLMRLIKGNSSRWINDSDKLAGRFRWQLGYGAFAVSESKATDVMRYIGGQKEHHRTTTFKEEFLAFLARNQVAYDERYIWE